MLSPHIWGLKYITVTGYVVVALLLVVAAVKVLFVSHLLLIDLWILLHMATMVCIVAYFITPWSSVDGSYGDLSTDPIIHTIAIGTASLVTVAFVCPPVVLIVVLCIPATMVFPPKVFVKDVGKMI